MKELRQRVLLVCETTEGVCFIVLARTWLQFLSIDLEGGKSWHSVSTAAPRSNHSIKERMSPVNQSEACGTFSYFHPLSSVSRTSLGPGPMWTVAFQTCGVIPPAWPTATPPQEKRPLLPWCFSETWCFPVLMRTLENSRWFFCTWHRTGKCQNLSTESTHCWLRSATRRETSIVWPQMIPFLLCTHDCTHTIIFALVFIVFTAFQSSGKCL